MAFCLCNDDKRSRLDSNQSDAAAGLRGCIKVFEEVEMAWSATRILWDEQVLLMWILLPPVFVVCGLLPFAAPILFHERKRSEAGHVDAAPKHALADRSA